MLPSSSLPIANPHDLIWRTSHGSIWRCRCCAAIRMRFGNVVLKLSVAPELHRLRDIVVAARGLASRRTPALNSGAPHTGILRRPPGAEAAEEFVFHVGDSGFGFVVTRPELEELQLLLQHACRVMGPAFSAAGLGVSPGRRSGAAPGEQDWNA